MVRERDEGDEIVVPPTIHALLQARLDALDSDERVVIERGSVEGEVFHRGSVARARPGRGRVGSRVASLHARAEGADPPGQLRPSPTTRRFRFRHLLIRDAAYESLPKATRAAAPRAVRDWLEHHDLVERDEILGYHLEQAHRYRASSTPETRRSQLLADRACDHLAAAGRAALDRGDFHAASSLLERATTVLPPEDEQRLALAPELAARVLRDRRRAVRRGPRRGAGRSRPDHAGAGGGCTSPTYRDLGPRRAPARGARCVCGRRPERCSRPRATTSVLPSTGWRSPGRRGSRAGAADSHAAHASRRSNISSGQMRCRAASASSVRVRLGAHAHVRAAAGRRRARACASARGRGSSPAGSSASTAAGRGTPARDEGRDGAGARAGARRPPDVRRGGLARHRWAAWPSPRPSSSSSGETSSKPS